MGKQVKARARHGGGKVDAVRHRHTRPVGSACANCATPLLGPWCHACGQYADDFHRSVRHLLTEALEGLLHFDGRLWRTLLELLVHPAKLTGAYIEGHRAAQLPPLRMYLVVLVVVFLAGSALSDAPVVPPSPAQQEAVSEPEPEGARVNLAIGNWHLRAAETWLKRHVNAANERPGEFKLMLERWSERFAFLMLPVAAASLSLLFPFQRRFLLYDHTIFAMHSLSFLGIVLSVWFAANRLLPKAVADLILLALPVHLFVHMRGVYGTGAFGTLARMATLFVLSLVGFGLLGLGLVIVGIASLGGT